MIASIYSILEQKLIIRNKVAFLLVLDELLSLVLLLFFEKLPVPYA